MINRPVYVTGNEHKARLFSQMIGYNLDHARVDVSEIQSLDVREIIEHKARAAFEQFNRPVIVEDTFLSFSTLGSLPGPLIKWFLQELECEGLCELLNGKDRAAVAGAAIAYFDGELLEIFMKELPGTISDQPRGDSGFGWNPIFIPEGNERTLGEMKLAEFQKYYLKIKPFAELRNFLDNLEA